MTPARMAVEGDQLRATKTGEGKGEQDQAIALNEPAMPASRLARGVQEPCELRRRQPVSDLLRLGRRL